MEQKTAGKLEEILSNNSSGILVGVLLVAVLASVVVGGFYAYHMSSLPIDETDPASWGQLGDYLGGVLNPIFGFLSVFALLVALVLQSRELRLSREELKVSQDELKLSREEQAKAAEALTSQNRVIQKQSFEQTFFSMLKLLGEVVAACNKSDRYMAGMEGIQTRTVTGRAALGLYILHSFALNWDAKIASQDYVKCVEGGMQLLQSRDAEGQLSLYARTLQIALEYLRHSGITPDEIYPKILRSQLSGNELRVIYFFCFDPRWCHLKELVEDYRLLAYLDHMSTGAGADCASFFRKTAFQES